ncbi:MAG: ABC transporter ATP-binding protein [Desulfomonile tiedjei]|nr:ABC transporter ATP-binding protein [Desulfomonile tiedjei]
MSLLRLDKVTVRYGDMEALSEVSMEAEEHAITSIVGSNGAGKSTMLKAISGLVACHSGSICFDGQVINALPCHRRVELGLIQIPEGRHVFPHMSVRENLELGSMTRRAKSKRRENLGRAMDLFPLLAKRSDQTAGTLSGGEQQMLAIGRGLMADPRLLMMDEPSLGLAPIIVKEIFGAIASINRSGTTILLVEQDVRASLEIAVQGFVLENRRMVLSGNAGEILASDKVRKAYLGL